MSQEQWTDVDRYIAELLVPADVALTAARSQREDRAAAA
jgi:hypothetical protein